MIPNIIFTVLVITALYIFSNNVKKIYRNINLGISIDRNDNKKVRLIQMLRIAFGQSKMIDKPIVGILHIVVYVGFLVINIELLEIIVDGVLGTHRVFAPYLGSFYNFLIGFFEIFALGLWDRVGRRCTVRPSWPWRPWGRRAPPRRARTMDPPWRR